MAVLPLFGFPNVHQNGLAGIADRNAILLLDFIQHVRERGASLKDALIESGAVRFRPILLSAGDVR